jgi:hypothetical protein
MERLFIIGRINSILSTPPFLSIVKDWSPTVVKEIGRAEAVYGRADHRLSKGGQGGGEGEGAVPAARVFGGELLLRPHLT